MEGIRTRERLIRCGWRLPLAVLTVWGGASCAPRAYEGGFDSPHPQARLYATKQAAESRDPSAIPRLIEGLDSDDPAVRFMSINALRLLTGEEFGYRHYAPEWERAEAVDRWVAAWEAGDLRVVEASQEVGASDAGQRPTVARDADPHSVDRDDNIADLAGVDERSDEGG